MIFFSGLTNVNDQELVLVKDGVFAVCYLQFRTDTYVVEKATVSRTFNY